MLATDFTVEQDGGHRSYLDLARAKEAGHDAEDPSRAEWIVPVRWIESLGRESAVKDADLFANQNSAVKLTHGYTLKKLAEAFRLDQHDA